MSVTSVPGFVASGIAAGIKPPGDADIAVVATEDRQPVTAAGIFTANKFTAAPVVVTQRHLDATAGQAAAVVLTSGNANAGTGAQGLADAASMCATAAETLDIKTEQTLVCSTGLIGYEMPMDVVTPGVIAAAKALNSEGGKDAAAAMMTTDTVAKHCEVHAVDQNGISFTVGGIAKGAAMLEPNMATMLAVLTTDAELSPAEAKSMLGDAAEPAFNSLTIDGAQSTNDTVLLLANGKAGRVAPEAIQKALTEVSTELAMKMADDAEGSTKTMFVDVVGAATHDEAVAVARGIANSQLIKCSWYGQDPYWGRVASEVGVRAESFDETTLSISYGDQTVYKNGKPASSDPQGSQPGRPMFDAAKLKNTMEQRHITLTVNIGQGEASTRVVTTDLTHAYIDENRGTS